jgi:hypothetical protein
LVAPDTVSPRTPGSHFTTLRSIAFGSVTPIAFPLKNRMCVVVLSLMKFLASPICSAVRNVCS